jgi:hypothetical protein
MICSLRSTAETAIGFDRNASKSMPDVNCSMIAIASTMSVNQRRGGGLKDKNRLAFDPFKHRRPQHLSVRQVGFKAKDIRNAALEVDPPGGNLSRDDQERQLAFHS